MYCLIKPTEMKTTVGALICVTGVRFQIYYGTDMEVKLEQKLLLLVYLMVIVEVLLLDGCLAATQLSAMGRSIVQFVIVTTMVIVVGTKTVLKF